MDEVVGQLNRLRQAVEKSGRRFVLVVAPDKSTMIPQYLPSSYVGKECAAKVTDQFWHRMNDEVGIVDLRQDLRDEAQRTGGQVYFQQDTHWTFYAGLTMSKALVERLQPGLTSNWQTIPGPAWTGPADLPNLIGSTGQDVTTRPGLAPDGRDDTTRWINADFRAPLTLQSVATDGMVTTKTAMLADSYTRFASGYLAAAFTDISITHVEDLLNDQQAVADRLAGADYVVVEVVERYLAAGVSPITNPQYVTTLVSTLAAHPR
jgi:hypothetical protein